MKVVAVNGSPRRDWNTAKILETALEEAQVQGAQVELMHLYDLRFTGCRSCFACKRAKKRLAHCALHDDLEPVLKKLLAADVILLGTPIYFGDVSAQMRALLERLWFPSLNYDKERTVNYPRDTVCGLVFTMNVDKPALYDGLYQQLSGNMERLVGPTQVLTVGDTLQFADYSKYISSMFDAEHKRRQHEEGFPADQQRAKDWVSRLIDQAEALKKKN